MRSLLSRRLAAVAVAGVTAVSLAGCGGGGGTALDQPASGTTASSGAPLSANANGTIDPAAFMSKMLASLKNAKTAHIESTTKVSGMDMTLTGDVDYGSKPISMRMSMNNPASNSASAAKIEMIYVDGKMYMGNPAKPGQYMLMSAQMLGNADLSSMDLASTFQSYSKAISSVQDKGTETKDGQSLHHYVMTLETAKIPKMGDGAAAAQLPKELSYDMWVDSQFRVAHTTMTLGSLGTVDMVMNHWNEPVNIQAPPAADVTKP